MHKHFWDFQIQSNLLIPTRRPDLVIVLKSEAADKWALSSRRTKEDKRKRKYRQVLRCCRRTEKSMEHEGDHDTNCNWRTRNDIQRLFKKVGRVENRRTSRDHPSYHIVKIDQKTRDSWRFKEIHSHSDDSERPSANACVRPTKKKKRELAELWIVLFRLTTE